MITFTIEADYMKDHSPKDLCHSCFHAAYIEIPPGWNGHFTQVGQYTYTGANSTFNSYFGLLTHSSSYCE